MPNMTSTGAITAPYIDGDLVEVQDPTTGTWTTASVLGIKRAVTSAFGLCWEGRVQTTSGVLVRIAVNDDGASRIKHRQVRPAPAEAEYDWYWTSDDMLEPIEIHAVQVKS
jgi:hypothetical protein